MADCCQSATKVTAGWCYISGGGRPADAHVGILGMANCRLFEAGRGAALIEKTLGAVRGCGLICIFCHWQRPIHDASRTGRLVLQRNTSSFCDGRDGS